MNRKETLNNSLKSIICNKSCTHCNLVCILEECESKLISTVFEETHGEKLYLDHVISHISNLSIEKGLNQNKEIIEMIETLKSFKQYIKEIKKGNKGERFAKKALDKLTVSSIILDNIELTYNEVTTEDDLIVINENGVFVIEVKYSDNDMCITKDGFYVPSYNTFASLGTRNILEQVSNERHVVLNILAEKSGSLNIHELSKKIHSVIFFANKNRRLFDKSNSENVVYCHNISSYISSFNNGIKLNNDEIQLYKSILQNNCEKVEYTIDFDLDHLRETFINGLCILENTIEEKQEKTIIKENSKLNKKISSYWKFDIVSCGIGALTTGLSIIGYQYLANKHVLYSK